MHVKCLFSLLFNPATLRRQRFSPTRDNHTPCTFASRRVVALSVLPSHFAARQERLRLSHAYSDDLCRGQGIHAPSSRLVMTKAKQTRH